MNSNPLFEILWRERRVGKWAGGVARASGVGSRGGAERPGAGGSCARLRAAEVEEEAAWAPQEEGQLGRVGERPTKEKRKIKEKKKEKGFSWD